MLASPEIKRGGGNFIYQRNGKPKSRQVYPFNVVFAGITGFDPDMVVFGRVKVSKFRRSLFAALSANYSTEFP